MASLKSITIDGKKYDVVGEVDNTLTKENVAADAKATGDKISQLSREIDNLKEMLVDGEEVAY